MRCDFCSNTSVHYISFGNSTTNSIVKVCDNCFSNMLESIYFEGQAISEKEFDMRSRVAILR